MRENKQSTRVVLWSRIQNFKQQQQSKLGKCDVQHGYAFKVAGYSFGKLHIDNLKGRLVSTPVIHMHVKKNQPILVRVL